MVEKEPNKQQEITLIACLLACLLSLLFDLEEGGSTFL
jgi:hypothetical protein